MLVYMPSNKTQKKRNTSTSFENDLANTFMEMLGMVKLFHWKTGSYATHVATDELYAKLNKHIDKFMEVLFGKHESRIGGMSMTLDIVNTEKTTAAKKRMTAYRRFLRNLDTRLDTEKDSELLSIRDDILNDLHQFTYLLSLK